MIGEVAAEKADELIELGAPANHTNSHCENSCRGGSRNNQLTTRLRLITTARISEHSEEVGMNEPARSVLNPTLIGILAL